MELQMKNTPSICIESFIDNITLFLSGKNCRNNSIVKVNNENLAINGEFYFLPSLKVWKSILTDGEKCDKKCATILEHFLHIRDIRIDDNSESDIANQVLQLLIKSTNDSLIRIRKYSLKKEKVCLFLQQTPIIENSIKATITKCSDFGRSRALNKVFSLKLLEDKESELTTQRLHLIQSVAEKLLYLYGCKIQENECDYNYIFTSKSQGNVEENYEKYVCGVVKNRDTKCKETKLTWQQYVQDKIQDLKELNNQKYFETHECHLNTEACFFENLALATITFELLSVKPSRPVFIGCNLVTGKDATSASFVLYNTARIASILEKYNDKCVEGEYPDLPCIDDIDFALLNQEEEWELVYNFIFGYQEMLNECFKYEPTFQVNPQVICIFLSRLCQKFSIYYRRTKILTEGYTHLMPTMTARLYLLQALQIVLQNALALLDIVPISRM